MGVFASTLYPPEITSTPTPEAMAIDNPDITQSVKRVLRDPEGIKQPDRMRPAGEAGMRIDIEMPASIFADMRQARGLRRRITAKFRWQDVLVRIGEGQAYSALLRVRGKSSTFTDRKSFNIRLFESQRLSEDASVRRFFLVNLDADPHAFETQFCYEILRKLGVFYSYSEFAVVYVNDQPQGLYLLVERPVDAARRVLDGVVSVYRAGWLQGSFHASHIGPGSRSDTLLRRLQAAIDLPQDGAQAKALARVVDLEGVYRFMAFNSLIQNADTIDEWYLVQTGVTATQPGRFSIMGWDYDDAQGDVLHSFVQPDPLTWAAESHLDRAILDNSVTYQQFAETLSHLLTQEFTPQFLSSEMTGLLEVLDNIDTGLPVAEQREARNGRKQAVARFMERLLDRRNELLDKLGALGDAKVGTPE